MSLGPGRSWILDMLESAHVFNSSFTDDPYRTAFAEGERNIGLKLFVEVVNTCPDEYVLMMRERTERNAARDRSNTRPDSEPEPGDDDNSDDTGADPGLFDR